MGPYVYKTSTLSIGTFGSLKSAGEKIQQEIERHVADGWELFQYRSVQGALVWKWNVFIFRKPSDMGG